MSPNHHTDWPDHGPLAWLHRAGPVTALVLALGCLTLLFVGCLRLTEASRRRHKDAAAPIQTVERLVRVRIGGRAPRASAPIEITTPFTVTKAAGSELLAEEGDRLPAATVRPAPGGGILLGARRLEADDVLITPQRDAGIILDGRTYRGRLRIRRAGEGLVFDNHVDAESYLRGVLRGELPRYFHPESFKTQAVAARTYVLYQKRVAPPDRSFDVVDDEGSQMYIGVQGEDPVAVRAVEQTLGEVCVWNDHGTDRVFCTYYASACGGLSQDVNNVKPNDPDVPPLAGNVRCDDCYLARFYRWNPVKLAKAEVTQRVVDRYASLSRLGYITQLKPKARTPDGRIIGIELVGVTGQSGTLIGEDFRLAIGGHTLKSTNFDLENHEDAFVFKNGKGYGHGVGLCQHGMETKARRGMDYKQILAIYYPGSTVKKIY